MPAFARAAFAADVAFSASAFDFDGSPGTAGTATPGFKKNLRGMRVQIRGDESEEAKYKRRLAQGIITNDMNQPKAEARAPEDPKAKRIREINERLRKKVTGPTALPQKRK